MRKDVIEALFANAPFVQSNGIAFVDAGDGWCVSRMKVSEQHAQHHGIVHAAVLFLIADHTAGGAATTNIASDQFILSNHASFHLLRPARSDELYCHAQVLKAGKQLIIVESSVYDGSDRNATLTAKGSFSMSVLQHRQQ